MYRQLDPQHGRYGRTVATRHDAQALATDPAEVRPHAGHAAVPRVDPLHLATLVNVHPMGTHTLRQPPHHSVVPDDAPRRMVQPGVDRERGAVRDVQPGNQFPALLRVEHLRPDAHVVVGARRHPEVVNRSLGVSQVEGPAVEEHEVEIELPGENGPELQPLVVEPHILGGALVGAHDRRVPAGSAEADVAGLEHRDVANAVSGRQVPGGRQAVDAAADDHHLVVALERRPTPQAPKPEPVHRSVTRSPNRRSRGSATSCG